MNRKTKIEILQGLKSGQRSIKELLTKDNPIILDENDDRPIVKAIKAGSKEVIYAKDFDSMAGLMKGFVIDLRNKQTKLLMFD